MLMELVDEWFKEVILESIRKGFDWAEGVELKKTPELDYSSI
jgi:hypothetical protein